MPGRLIWQNEERCVIGDTVFQTLPVGLLDRDEPHISMEGADFFLFKEKPLIDEYVELIEELQPQHIVELGIMEGGSTAFLLEVARPRRLVAIDIKPPTKPALRDYVSSRGLEDVARIHDHVDQADRERLAEIVDASFGASPLDLVVDDCSHLYEPTRASFNELFPRLRRGGVYAIEDWSWAHATLGSDSPNGLWTDQVPLTRLVFELVLAVASVPGLVSSIVIEEGSLRLRRGDADIGREDFDISACSTARGRGLLATESASSAAPGND
jgi:predicted O-methyltransferase YrrM